MSQSSAFQRFTCNQRVWPGGLGSVLVMGRADEGISLGLVAPSGGVREADRLLCSLHNAGQDEWRKREREKERKREGGRGNES